MPVVIRRPKPKQESWRCGFEFDARSPSGTLYSFRVTNEEEGLAIDKATGKVWWIDSDRRAVRLGTSPSVVALIER